jgi:hypothetical protein
MKRLFPRAVPETVITLLFVVACAPSSPVKPGAPVLTTLTIVAPNGSSATRYDVTAATTNCPAGYADGMNCDPTTPVCELGSNTVCHCDAKGMCDPTVVPDAAVTDGTLHCTYPPLSFVVATFDRLLDTTPFQATSTTSVATLTSMPAVAGASLAANYTSTGSTTGLIFTNFAALTGGAFPNITGPTIALTGSPAIPSSATVTVTLDMATVHAKDQNTPYTGTGLLQNGTIAFQTTAFTASITPPAPPPPMATMMTMMTGCPDAGTTSPDGAADATEGGSDAPASEGGAADGGTDALAEAGAPEVGATTDAAASDAKASDAGPSDAGPSDAGASDAGASDAGASTPPASSDVPLSMNTATIEIDFTNTVGMDVMTQITMTKDGMPFTDFSVSTATVFPTATVKIAPGMMGDAGGATWAAGSTYTITVGPKAADVLSETLGANAPAPASFTMSAN